MPYLCVMFKHIAIIYAMQRWERVLRPTIIYAMQRWERVLRPILKMGEFDTLFFPNSI